MSDPVLQAAMKAVVVNSEGRVLILREAATYGEGTQHGRWHMPGGRIKPGEPFEDALRREVREESGLEIDIKYPVYVGEWRPIIKGVPHQIVATFIICEPLGTDVKLSTEHDAFEWIKPAKRKNYDIMEPEDEVIDRFAEIAGKL